MHLFDIDAMFSQLDLCTLLGLFAGVRIVNGSLEAAEDTINILARLVGGVDNRKVVDTEMHKELQE